MFTLGVFKSQRMPMDSHVWFKFEVLSYGVFFFFLNVSVKLVGQSSPKIYMQQGTEKIIGYQIFYFGPIK